MENTNISLVLIVGLVGIALIIVGLAVLSMRRRSSKTLQAKFGPEYDLALEKSGDKHVAEDTLKQREKRVSTLNVHDLNETEQTRYRAEWIAVQAAFVDDPTKSVAEAHRLITEVMIARGFPVVDFEQRAADLSVFYPDFVTNYRNANAITVKNQSGGSSTEEIRQAMVYYRSLFDELLGINPARAAAVPENKVAIQ